MKMDNFLRKVLLAELISKLSCYPKVPQIDITDGYSMDI